MAKLWVRYPDQAEVRPPLSVRITRTVWAVFCWAVAFGSVVFVSLMSAH
jgi:hypothetical protein